MKLTSAERWILHNQYEILARLDPSRKDECEQIQEALAFGYERELRAMGSAFTQVLSDDECTHIIEILEMFQALSTSFNKLEDKSGIDEHRVRFVGFDGHAYEGRYVGYVNYLFRKNGAANTGMDMDYAECGSPNLGRYERMFANWELLGRKDHLSREDILTIIE